MDNASEAVDSSYWRAVDTILFSKAKRSYDEIIRAFEKPPRVYKLECCKEKIWLDLEQKQDQQQVFVEDEYNQVDHTLAPESPPDDPNVIDLEIKTCINPFQLVPTLETPYIGSSEEVWAQKLHVLQKLTPRDDLAGYEYKESLQERKSRLHKQHRFYQKLQSEIKRRESNPTMMEEVEDVLFDVVETVVKREERLSKVLRHREKRQIQRFWHPSTLQCRLRPLLSLTNSAGSTKPILSDLPVEAALVTEGGYALATKRPWHLLLRHELEREVRRAMERRLQELDALARQEMPLTAKAAAALKSFRENPHAAASLVVTQLGVQLSKWQLALRDRLGWSESAAESGSGSGSAPAATTSDPDFSFLQSWHTDQWTGVSAEGAGEGADLEAFIQQKYRGYERLDRESSPPEAAMVTVLCLGDLPPPYTVHPAQSWREKLRERGSAAEQAALRLKNALSEKWTSLSSALKKRKDFDERWAQRLKQVRSVFVSEEDCDGPGDARSEVSASNGPWIDMRAVAATRRNHVEIHPSDLECRRPLSSPRPAAAMVGNASTPPRPLVHTQSHSLTHASTRLHSLPLPLTHMLLIHEERSRLTPCAASGVRYERAG